MRHNTKTEIEFTTDETTGITGRCKVYKMGVLDYPSSIRHQNMLRRVYTASIPVLESYFTLINNKLSDIVTKYGIRIRDITNEKHDIEDYCPCPFHMDTKKEDIKLDGNAQLNSGQNLVFYSDSIEKYALFVENLINDDTDYSKQKYKEILSKNKSVLSNNAGKIMAESDDHDD